MDDLALVGEERREARTVATSPAAESPSDDR
jgi:hypothetical protein